MLRRWWKWSCKEAPGRVSSIYCCKSSLSQSYRVANTRDLRHWPIPRVFRTKITPASRRLLQAIWRAPQILCRGWTRDSMHTRNNCLHTSSMLWSIWKLCERTSWVLWASSLACSRSLLQVSSWLAGYVSNNSSGRSICHIWGRKAHQHPFRPEPCEWVTLLDVLCSAASSIPARQMHCRRRRIGRLAKLHQGGTDMVSSPVASAEVCQVHQVNGRYQGVLQKGAQNYSACLLNSTACLHWDWPSREDMIFRKWYCGAILYIERRKTSPIKTRDRKVTKVLQQTVWTIIVQTVVIIDRVFSKWGLDGSKEWSNFNSQEDSTRNGFFPFSNVTHLREMSEW